MPMLEREQGSSIYYEVHGEGFPLVLFAPGGVRSSIPFWSRAAYNPIHELSSDFRVIAIDQRNAGRSRAPIRASDGWHSYTEDHVALLDHLGIERAHLLGNCIGPSFQLSLIVKAPERVAAAVLQQPIGLANDNRELFRTAFDSWASEIAPLHSETSTTDFAEVRERRYGGDFAFSVTREEVSAIRAPLLVLLGNDAAHPSETSREIAALAPHAELVERWKEPEVVAETVKRVRSFLKQHTPR
jgi:pimeloyl-ACP methyl ester carboxylesterase